MPFGAPSVCTSPGCSALTNKGSRCDLHPYEQHRSKSVSDYKYLYNSKRWKTGRLIFLGKHPLCEDCLLSNKTEAATVVDHVEPHGGDLKLFFNHQNWRAVCKRHHDIKTARYDGGFGNVKR